MTLEVKDARLVRQTVRTLDDFASDDDELKVIGLDALPSGVLPVVDNNVTAAKDIGPLIPLLGRLIIVTTTGAGTAQLLRSVDGGTTKRPVTQGGVTLGPWSGPINEPVWIETEAGATLYLRLIPSSGTMTGRIAQ